MRTHVRQHFPSTEKIFPHASSNILTVDERQDNYIYIYIRHQVINNVQASQMNGYWRAVKPRITNSSIYMHTSYGRRCADRMQQEQWSPILCFAGYFKDKHDSYNGLYYLVAAACVLVAILWCVIVMADSIKGLILRRPIHANALAIPAWASFFFVLFMFLFCSYLIDYCVIWTFVFWREHF